MSYSGHEIAIIGISLRFPGANNIKEFWSNLENGIESIKFFTDEELLKFGVDSNLLKNPNYVKSGGGIIENKGFFDASFFGYTPNEAIVMNPQTRLLHELAWKSIENAGYNPYTFDGRIGLFSGLTSSFGWEAKSKLSGKSGEIGSFDASQLTNKDFSNTRVSYNLNLRGPSLQLYTACSTSLVNVHTAMRSLLLGECDMALAGGVALHNEDSRGYLYQEGMIPSKDGHCRPFDEHASGTASSQGGALILLKPLKKAIEDNDNIYSIIKGSAINNDGNRKVGYTAPSTTGQVEVLRSALNIARIKPGDISYVECHGTATKIGDAIEIKALKKAFNIEGRQSCPIGSVKSNIGHLDSGAGVAGLIKTVLSLKNKKIPPSINFKNPNKNLELNESPFYVIDKLKEWNKSEDIPRRAGVSSFGIGGTNAHIILEEYNQIPDKPSKRKLYPVLISAKSKKSLDGNIEQFNSYLNEYPENNIADISYTLIKRRNDFQYRCFSIYEESKDPEIDNFPLEGSLKKNILKNKNINAIFVFPGGGAQYINMAKQIYETESVFKMYVDKGVDIVSNIANDNYYKYLFPEDKEIDIKGKMEEPEIALPLLFIIEYALAKFLMNIGIHPEAMIGHSLGEYTAACISDVISFEDAINLVLFRGKLMKKVDKGIMMSVQLSDKEIGKYIDSNVSIAAINSHENCVLSGSQEHIERLHKIFSDKGFEAKILRIDVASHSHLMDSVLAEFREFLSGIQFNEPKYPMISNVSGSWITERRIDAEYWVEHLRKTVKFSEGIQTLNDTYENIVYIEVGPNNILSQIINENIFSTGPANVVNMLRRPKETQADDRYLLDKLGVLWILGCNLKWEKYYEGEERHTINLPNYVFDYENYWIDDKVEEFFLGTKELPKLNIRNKMEEWFYYPTWKRTITKTGISQDAKKTNNNILVFANQSEICQKLIRKYEAEGNNVVLLYETQSNNQVSSNEFQISLKTESGIENVMSILSNQAKIPARIIHFWSCNEDIMDTDLKNQREIGFYSLIYTAKAIYNLNITDNIYIDVITNKLHNVNGTEITNYHSSTILGPILTIPQQMFNIKCRNIDVVLSDVLNDLEIDNIYNELEGNNNEKVVAFRHKYRWTLIYEQQRLEKSISPNEKLKNKGVYLVIGGLGRIGFTILEHLARNYQPVLLITGLTELPDRDDWKEWLQKHDNDNKVSKKIKKIQLLEAKGASVIYKDIDLSNKNKYRAFINSNVELYDKLNGIIYCATATLAMEKSFKAIEEIDVEFCEKHFNPKINGLINLIQALEGVDFEFFLIMSSISSVLGGLGYTPYSASNIFMDYLAEHYRKTLNKPILSVCWDGWKYYEDIAEDEEEQGDLLRMSVLEGQEAFEKIMQTDFNENIVHSITDLNKRIDQWVNLEGNTTIEDSKNSSKEVYARPNIFTEYRKPETKIEKELSEIWQNFFGYENIGIDDSFFELGGNSLKAIALINNIRKKLNVSIPIKEFFKRENISKLANYIKSTDDEGISEIKMVEKKQYYPLTPSQNRLFHIFNLNKKSTAYNLTYSFLLNSGMNKSELEHVFYKIIERHESLRTSFLFVENEVVQKINPISKFEIKYKTIENNDIEGSIKSFIRPFNLHNAPLIRVGLLSKSTDENILVINIHHIVIDGISFGVLIKEFNSIINGESLPPVKLQYKDFARHQSFILQSPVLQHQRNYWLNEFSGELSAIELPTDFARVPNKSYSGASVISHLTSDESLALKEIANSAKVSMYSLFLTIYNIFIHKITTQDDIIIGTVAAGRKHHDLNKIIGFFINTLPLRNFPTSKKTFQDFLQEVNNRLLDAIDNQDYQFNHLVEELDLARDASREVLFDITFDMQNFEFDNISSSKLELKNIKGLEKNVSKYDLGLTVHESSDTITFDLEYCTALFKKETIERFQNYLKIIISSIIKNTQTSIGEIKMMNSTEEENLLVSCLKSNNEQYKNSTLVQLIEEQIDKTPNNIAFMNGGLQISYSHLNCKANKLANYLLKLGVKKQEPVGIMLKDSLNVVISIIAILKSGGAYVPIDLESPHDRRRIIIDDCKLRFLLVDDDVIDEKIKAIQISVTKDEIDTCALTNPNVNISPKDSAYIIYTSGSTGIPKGVVSLHEGIANTIQCRKDEYQLSTVTSSLGLLNYVFDAYISSMLSPLISGSRSIVISSEDIMDMRKVAKIISNRQITHLITTPSYYSSLLEQDVMSNKNNLKIVTLGGEKINKEFIIRSNTLLPKVEIVQEYGITEASVVSTIFRNQEKSNVSLIGKTISNVSAYILDESNNIQPYGIIGELHIGGIGIASGYFNDPTLSDEKFISNPFCKNEKIYKTGDLARWLPDGNIEFIERKDHQLKIRGFRVELGEIENAIQLYENIIDNVVVFIEKGKEKYLVVYYVSKETIEDDVLRIHLSDKLPSYMIPSAFVQTDVIPLTANGKVDVNKLKSLQINYESNFISPSDELEEKLVHIWSKVLKIKKEQISTNKSFFEIGGHSLLATILTGKIYKEIGVEFPLREVFLHSTIKSQASQIAKSTKKEFVSIPKTKEQSNYSLSSAQKRLYLLQQFDLTSTAYNMPYIIPLGKELDKSKIEKVFKQLINRHESFRTSIILVDQEPVQVISKDVEFELGELSIENTEVENIRNKFIKPFDLSKAPFLRVTVVDIKGEDSMLMIDMHHIISDGTSHKILEQEFQALLSGEKLASLPLQYKDYSQWQNSKEQQELIKDQEQYWLNKFEGEIPVLNLPTDYVRPLMQSHEGATVSFVLNKEETEGLKFFTKENDLTLYMSLLSVLSILLSKLSGQDDIVVGTPIAGRRHVDIENIVGMFVNTLAIRNQVKESDTIKEFVSRLKQITLGAYENQDYQFEDLVGKASVERDTSHNPMFDVMINLLNQADYTGDTSGIDNENLIHIKGVSKFDLSINAVDYGEQLMLRFEYCTQLFKAETIDRFIVYFKQIVSQLAKKPEIKISALDILTEEEKHQLLYEFNNTQVDYPKDKTIHQLFEEQVERCPDKLALEYKNKTFTYQELNEESNQIAHYLIEKGLKREDIVGIELNSSYQYVVCMFAVLKAGGAFLPIDKKLPDLRKKYIVENSELKILIHNDISYEKDAPDNIESINVQKLDVENYQLTNPSVEINPSNLAYIIYTSGSTGKPKGTLLEHKGIVSENIFWKESLKINPDDKCLQFSNISFDASIWEIYLCLFNGASLYIPDENIKKDTSLFEEYLEENQITVATFPPPFADNLNESTFKNLRLVITAGSETNSKLIEKISKNTRYINAYGPTETSVCATYWDTSEFNKVGKIVIGRSIQNIEAYIIDSRLQLQGIGISGELCFSGEGLARGYLKNPELTAEKFITHPFKEGERLYRTGDLARWLPDGNIEFLGRIDHQVKIRGFRIELGEIESTLLKHENIKESVVIARKENGDKYLCAYLVTEEDLNEEEIRTYLSASLPDYMIPSYFVELDKIPLTTNGKVNRKILPSPVIKAGDDYVAPRNETDKKLVGIWSEVLNIPEEEISITLNFFNIGGHSLKATILLNKLYEETGFELKLSDFFKIPTIKEISDIFLIVNEEQEDDNCDEISISF